MRVSDIPHLMREWDLEKNSALGLDPARLRSRSNKKAWWKCSQGHSWLATIDHRTKGRSCPYCSKRAALKGDNDLQTTHPDLAREWDVEVNDQLRPDEVTEISIKRVGWICAVCGHRWMARIRDRTLKGAGCDKCASKLRAEKRIATFVSKRKSLAEIKPQLLKDWDYNRNAITPESITSHSNKKVWWRCHKCEFEWEAKINNRSNGRGCPCCSHKKLVRGKNDLATTHPDIAKEWHPTKNGSLMARDVMSGQQRKVWWMCPLGHSYKATIAHRTSPNGTNCPDCIAGRQTSFREQAFYYYLKQIFPDAISRFKAGWLGRFELDIYIPSRNLALEYDGAAWHRRSCFSRERRKYELCHKRGIKLFRIKENMPGESDAQSIADDIFAIEDIEGKGNFERLLRFVLDRLDPRSNMFTRRMASQVHSSVSVDLERDRYKIIKSCSRVKNSLAELRPDIAKEWHPVKNEGCAPAMFPCGSDFKAWWICPNCNSEYESAISKRVSGTACPKCGREKQAATRRRNCALRSGGIKDARLLEEWNYEKNGKVTPKDFAPNSGVKVWWRCKTCGHEWQAKIVNRTHGRGCPCCARRAVVSGKNDLATLYPDLAKEWNCELNGSKTPESIVPGHNGRVWWTCPKCGYVYQASPSNRTSKGSGCRKCANKEIWSIRRSRKNALQPSLSR